MSTESNIEALRLRAERLVRLAELGAPDALVLREVVLIFNTTGCLYGFPELAAELRKFDESMNARREELCKECRRRTEEDLGFEVCDDCKKKIEVKFGQLDEKEDEMALLWDQPVNGRVH